MQSPLQVAIVCLALLQVASPVEATEIWTSAPEPQWREVRGWPPNDYLDLFRPGAPWGEAAKHVSAFDLTERFVETASDEQLKAVIDGLRVRNIGLSMQAVPLTATRECGLGVEGYGPPDQMDKVAERLQQFGADLKYVRLDEPFYFGHLYRGSSEKIACRSSAAFLAQDAAHKLAKLFRLYPNVQVGDTEPIDATSDGKALAEEIIDWHNQFRAATGRKIDFFDVDIVWTIPGSAQRFADALSVLRQTALPIGVIYHGARNSSSDKQWVDQAIQQFQFLEGDLGISPDRVSLESWMDRPRNLLPETADGTLTNLIYKYVQWRDSHKRPIQPHLCGAC